MITELKKPYNGIWISKCDPTDQNSKSYYTVYYCPRCKRQMTFHSQPDALWHCDRCDFKYRFNRGSRKFELP